MKKTYILATIALSFAFSMNAQIIDDDMESWDLGSLHEEHWSSWDGTAGPGDIVITDAFADSGAQSGTVGGDGAQDALLLLGDQSTGIFELRFQMYIPGGKSGYFNLQGLTEAGGAGGGGNAGVFNSPNLIFNNVQSVNGTPGQGGAYGNVTDDDALYTWSYPQDFWFTVSIIYDVDATIWTMSIDGVTLAPQPFDADGIVGGVDFYSFDANNEFYIDDVYFGDVLGVEDFSADAFSVYPNPVQNILNISTKATVDSVTVYDILGKVVLSATPDMISPSIDMSGLASGAYLVNVTIGNSSKTVKVIK